MLSHELNNSLAPIRSIAGSLASILGRELHSFAVLHAMTPLEHTQLYDAAAEARVAEATPKSSPTRLTRTA